jgi:hypothetical protein
MRERCSSERFQGASRPESGEKRTPTCVELPSDPPYPRVREPSRASVRLMIQEGPSGPRLKANVRLPAHFLKVRIYVRTPSSKVTIVLPRRGYANCRAVRGWHSGRKTLQNCCRFQQGLAAQPLCWQRLGCSRQDWADIVRTGVRYLPGRAPCHGRFCF